MKRCRATTLVVVALLLATAQAGAGARAPQDAVDEVLTNETVTDMTKAGLSTAILVAKIRASRTDFDVSSDALIRLKQDGVDEDVIAAMIDAAGAAPAPGTRRRIALNRAQPAPRAISWYPPTPSESGIYFLKELGAEGQLVLVEPSIYTQSKSTGAWKQALTYGIAKVRYKTVLSGAHARLQITDRRPTFYFYFDVPNAGLSSANSAWGPATSANEFILARLDVKKSSRELEVGESGQYTGQKYGVATKASRDFDYERLEPGVYKVTPKADLEDGEYCFLYAGGVATSGAGAGPKLFDFGVKK